jgi:hypothetical protein
MLIIVIESEDGGRRLEGRRPASSAHSSAVIDRRDSGSCYDGKPLRAISSTCSQKRSNSPRVV